MLLTSGNTPSNMLNKVFDSALENQELEREAENTAQKMMMASFYQIVKEAEEEDVEKEDAWLARIEVLRKKFADAAHQKGRYKADDNPIPNFFQTIPTAMTTQVMIQVMMVFMVRWTTMKTRILVIILQMDLQKRRRMINRSWDKMQSGLCH